MNLGFKISGRIARPPDEVFDAVVNPASLSAYFTTVGGASAPLVPGATVTWWGEVPVTVDAVEAPARIALRWPAHVPAGEPAYQTRIEMRFEPLDDGATLVTIAETGWREGEAGLRGSYLNCEGWTQMLCSLKAWLEHGLNLRDGYYPSELRGAPARAPRSQS